MKKYNSFFISIFLVSVFFMYCVDSILEEAPCDDLKSDSFISWDIEINEEDLLSCLIRIGENQLSFDESTNVWSSMKKVSRTNYIKVKYFLFVTNYRSMAVQWMSLRSASNEWDTHSEGFQLKISKISQSMMSRWSKCLG